MAAIQQKCRKCSSRYLVSDEDRVFYSKLQLPSPALCPDCRVQRRMTWRNDRTFYVRKSDLSGKQMIAIYPPKTPFPVYHPSEWYGDLWNALSFGQEFDNSRPFFEQWHELMLKVPRLGVDIVNCENSDYCNYCGDDKNCYLDIAGEANRDCYYNLFTKYSRDCVDCTFVYNSELCYESINCYQCYAVVYSMYLEGCHECSYCFDLKGCHDCLLCWNLRNKSYCVFNQQLTEKEYKRTLEQLRLHTHTGALHAKELWRSKVLMGAIHRDSHQLNSEGCTGNDIKGSKNCRHVFNVSDCKDSNYLYDVLDATDCYDLNYSLYKPEVCCELISTLGLKFSACNMASHYCSEIFYCDQCNNSHDLFGCIGLNRAQYCILNKQYSREEYKNLKKRIIEHMQRTGEWGEFFPSTISPFGYNETVAQEYFPLTAAEAKKLGFIWREPQERGLYEGPKAELPESAEEANDELTTKVLTCEQSHVPYKIIKPELQFYRRMNIPLPRQCPQQRHADRSTRRNPRALWPGQCDRCGDAIVTSHSPDSEYKVYCNRCYNEAVY